MSESYRPLEREPPVGTSAPQRPPTYYEDGPFDAPSSEEGEEDDIEVYGEKATKLDEEEGLLVGKELKQDKKRSPLRWLMIALGSLVLLAAFLGFFAARTYTGNKGSVHTMGLGTEKITMDHIFNGTFGHERKDLRWIPEAGDGVYSIQEDGFIKLVNLATNTTENLVQTHEVKDGLHNQLSWDAWSLSHDMRYVLVKSDGVKQWRHSSHASYYIHDRTINFTRAIAPPKTPPLIATALLAPDSNKILFVQSNDLYILRLPAVRDPPIRITLDGSKTVFNGVPDWVYEEEVFSGDRAFWWSPGVDPSSGAPNRYVAFLRFDESAVDEYVFPVYNEGWDGDAVQPYTNFTTMKYPKPGYSNPLVSLHLYDTSHETEFVAPIELEWEDRRPLTDSVITEVVWTGPTSLLIKEVDRSASQGHVIHFDISAGLQNLSRGKVVRRLGKDGEEGDDGWIDASQAITPLKDGSYLDIIPSKEGFNHIVHFASAESTTPRFVTNGEWEVTGKILGVDEVKGVVFFQAAAPSSVQRHIFSALLPISSVAGTQETVIEPLTPTWDEGYFTASFSPLCGFYVLNNEGPGVPWQKVFSVTNSSFEYVLTDNKRLDENVSRFVMPSKVLGSIMSDGYELNTIEIRPPGFDDSGRTKYPVFFQVYGGPSAQLVDARFSMGWHEYLATSLKYVIVRVDGRGTGFKGRKFRNMIKRHLGRHEVIDQINAAKEWSEKKWVDRRRIGIWGWSYGGYMTAKIAEANAGYHKLAISVAPVTDWRLYDSVYTERYMGLPSYNEEGYDETAVRNVTGFDQIDYALAHGSGDDNVHFANTAHLIDMFTTHHIRKYRFRMFTDSDHSISTRGAYRELHEWLTAFLMEKWGHGVIQKEWS